MLSDGALIHILWQKLKDPEKDRCMRMIAKNEEDDNGVAKYEEEPDWPFGV